MATVSYRNAATADIAAGLNSKAARTIPQRVWKVARRKLDALRTASSLNDLGLPGLRLEALKGDRLGYYSIRVNDQYRIVFLFANGESRHVEVVDYHY